MIDIKDISGKTRFSTPINKGAKGKFTLMKEDYIILPFSVSEPIYFKLGDYVDLSGVLDESLGGLMSKRYEIVDLQSPAFNTSTGGYDYQLRLDAYYWKWKNKIFKYTPEHAGYEASWSLTAALDVQLGVFLRNLKALGYTYNGKEFVFEIDSTVENKAVAMTYDNMNLLDALFSMAGEDKWNCDCWITDNVIHFGRNEYGDAVKIESGVEASAMTRSESKGTYATRIYAFGGTKNIPENYRPIEEQTVVNGVVQKRLMLPSGTPYIDVYPDMSTEEAIEDVVVFDDVFPKRVGTLSDVKTVDRALTGEDGEQTGTFKAYQYKDTGLNFKKEYIIEGQELEIIFQSGKLNGLKFGAIFEPEGTSTGSQIWEIRANEDYGRLLPDDTLYPENGDKYILTGFDIQLVSDQYVPESEQELKEKAQKYAEQRKKDDGTYNTTLDSDWVYEDKLTRFFEFGQKVNLVNKAFFENGRESRILGWEFNLDVPWDSPTYVIGESMPYSRLNDMEEKLESLTYKGQTYTSSGGGSSIYIIKANDSTTPSDSNVFSARRSLATLLRKDKEDQTNYLIKLLGGIISPFLKSPDFVTGGLGAGFTLKQNEDGTSYAEVDRLLVRMKAVFQVLEIMKTELGGASFLFNSSGARVEFTKVEQINYRVCFSDGKPAYTSDGKALYLNSVYRCWFLADDGDTAVTNKFKVGDLVRSQTFDIKEGVYENVSNRYWWRKVVGVGDDYIDLYSVEASADSDIPKSGDVAVQLGNESDADRQSAIVLSAYGDGAPYMTFYQGINSYSLSGKDVFSVGYDKVKQACYFRVYGSTYIGAKDESSYISFDPTTNKMKIRAEVEITSGSGFGNLTDKPDIDGMNEGIQNAQNSANAAQESANNAQQAANEAAQNAASARNDLATNLGYSSYDDMVSKAESGSTIIKGGHINTTLIEAKAITASQINADGITANEVNLTGTITANDGVFKGNINIGDGKNKINKDGSGSLANGQITWSTFGILKIRTAISSPFINMLGVYNPNNDRVEYKLDLLLNEGKSNFVVTANNGETTYIYFPTKDLNWSGITVYIYNAGDGNLMTDGTDLYSLPIPAHTVYGFIFIVSAGKMHGWKKIL